MDQNSTTIFLGFAEQRFPAGVHICQVFADDEERQDSLLKFILSGLQSGERTSCFSDQITEPVVSQFLDRHNLSCQEARVSGAFFMSEARETYIEGGRFDPERMLNFLARYYEDSIREGYSAARVIGEMSADIQHVPGGTRLLEYEARVSLLQRDHPVTAVCQYDARSFDGAMIMDILKVHPFMVVKGSVVYNPFYTPPEQFLASRGKQSEKLCPKITGQP